MSESNHLPRLAILPVEKLILHEYHDHQRTPPIIQSLRASGVIRNPPIVMPLEDGSGRFMVLDGANRATAFQDMGIPHVLAQVVHVDDTGLELNSWNHVIWGVPPGELFAWLQATPETCLLPTTPEHLFRSLLDLHSLAAVLLADGRLYTASASTFELIPRVAILNTLVSSYARRARIDRTLHYAIEPLAGLYSDLSGLVLLPPFKIGDVLCLAGSGHLMPAGSTRFTIPARALHLNFPLEILTADWPLDEKNAYLKAWMQERLAQKRVRYYAEPTFLFDE